MIGGTALSIFFMSSSDGVIGGCSSLHSVEQARTGNAASSLMLRQRPANAICIQIARLYDDTIRLDGAFPPPRAYRVRVNGTETPFMTNRYGVLNCRPARAATAPAHEAVAGHVVARFPRFGPFESMPPDQSDGAYTPGPPERAFS
jgi:hypothetical protein